MVYCAPEVAVAAAKPPSGVATKLVPTPAASGASASPMDPPRTCLNATQFAPSPNSTPRYLELPAARNARRVFSLGFAANAVASSARPNVCARSKSVLQKPPSCSTSLQLLGSAGSLPTKRKPSSTAPFLGGSRFQLFGSAGLPPANRNPLSTVPTFGVGGGIMYNLGVIDIYTLGFASL